MQHLRVVFLGLLATLTVGCMGGEPTVAPEQPAESRIKKPKVRTPTAPAEDPNADEKAAEEARKRPGVGEDCEEGTIIAERWPGEYPGPVVEVLRGALVRGRRTPCGKKGTRCRIPPGIYHPWATPEQDHDATYSMVRAVEPFEVAADIEIGGQKAAKGDVVEVHNYLGEGVCAWWVGGPDLTEASCPDLHPAKESLIALEPVEFTNRPVFKVTCVTGTSVWVDADTALLERSEVQEGTFLGFGSVGPAATKD